MATNQSPKVGASAGNRGKGRKKGVPNKTTALLKDAILQAADDVGYDGEGKDGLCGYLRAVAMKDTKAYAGLLGRVLPMQVTGEDGGAVVVEIRRFAAN